MTTAIPDSPLALMRSIIQRTATGPELSKSISMAEAQAGMKAILGGHIDPVQSAIFLISLRMKRETDDENKGILSAIQDYTQSVIAPVDEVLDLSDPYNGYNRTLPASPFLPALMASFDVATINHGIETTSPKYGITHKQILRAAGIPVDFSPEQAAQQLNDSAGWSYVDQSQFCPALAELSDLRAKIIKRTVITTVEVLSRPIRGQQKTHLLTGYVHKPYTRIYSLLARHAGFNSALLARGVEGGVIPSLRQSGKFVSYQDFGEEQDHDMHPADLNIQQDIRAVSFPDDLPPSKNADEVGLSVDALAAAQAAAHQGMAALQGKTGAIYDGLLYTATVTLAHLGRFDSPQTAAKQVRQMLNNGQAWQRFQALQR